MRARAIVALVALSTVAGAAAADRTSCRLKFDLKTWSAFYKSSRGEGTITCDNGQEAAVRIRARGGGVTFGRSEIVGGEGVFSPVRDIEDLFGSYAQAEAHAGAGKSAAAGALTKGEVSLALSGTGHGMDVGFSFGKFQIRPAGASDDEDDGVERDVEEEERP